MTRFFVLILLLFAADPGTCAEMASKDNICLQSIDPDPTTAREFFFSDAKTWQEMNQECILNCINCRLIWNYTVLVEAERKLCAGADLVPFYNATRKNWNLFEDSISFIEGKLADNDTEPDFAAAINLKSGVSHNVALDEPLFTCAVCKKPPFVMSAMRVPTFEVMPLVGYNILLASKQPAVDQKPLVLDDPVVQKLELEVVRNLRVEPDNVYLRNSYVETGRYFVHIRVTEYVFFVDDPKYTEFDIQSSWEPGICLGEKDANFTWLMAEPDEVQSRMIGSTETIAVRKCQYNTTNTVQDTQWLSREYFIVSWKPCTDWESKLEIDFMADGMQVYLGDGDYLPMQLANWENATVKPLILEKTSLNIETFLETYYFYGKQYVSRKPIAEYIIDLNLFSILEVLIVKMDMERSVNFSVTGFASMSSIIILNLQLMPEVVGAEAIIGEKLEYQTTSTAGSALPHTAVKITVSDSLLSDNTRLAFTMFTLHDLKNDTGRDHRHNILQQYEFVIQLILYNDEETTLYSSDSVDIWVNNSQGGADDNRICESFDFETGSWSIAHCTVLISQRSGLDVFRCSHLGQTGGITRGYFHVYFHDTTLSDYLANNPTFKTMMSTNLVISAIGLLSILLTALFYEDWMKDVGHKILMHMLTSLTVNLILGFVNNLVNIDPAKWWCILFGVIRHYSFLAMFCWMLVMSGLQMKRLMTIQGAKDTSHLLLKVFAFAWGVPLVPIVILLAWHVSFYSATDSNSGSCYPGGLAFKLTVLAPSGSVLVFNLFVFVRVLCHIFECGPGSGAVTVQRHGISDRSVMMRRVGTTFFMFFLFGFTWLFHFMSEAKVIHSEFLYEYLFLMTATSHIFILAAFFVIFDTKVRNYWREKLCATTKK